MQQHPTPDTGPQIIVGNYIYQPGQPQGGMVQVLTAASPSFGAGSPTALPTPVAIRPRPFRQLLGREPELAWMIDLLQQHISAELYSEPGMGKTVLLRHLAYHPVTGQFPDGVVYLVASQEPAEDVLHALYTAFYQSASPHKPTESDLRRSLQAKNALVILDDFDAGRDNLDMLLNAAPMCTFLVSSPDRTLWGDGEAKALLGLRPENALALLERVWQRPLTEVEQPAAADICTALKGHPLRIQQAITAAREQNLTLRDVALQVQSRRAANHPSLPQLRQQLIAAFDENELQDLCFDLGVDYGSLPAQGKANKARELLETMVRHGRLADLLANCTTLRPHLNWGEPTQTIVDPSINALPVAKRDILSVLAAFGSRPLSAELISQLVGQADVGPLLEELMERGLVQNTAYHLAGSLPHRFQSALEPILLFVVEWAAEQATAVLQREAKTLAFLQQWAVTNGRPAEALQLGRLLDDGLALDGRWGLWQQVLLTAQQAAQSLGDQAAEAWALNQLGCRALCLGDKGVARIQLERAKALNEAVGHEAGVAVNEHNLGLLRGAPVARSGWRRFVPFVVVGIVLLVLLGWWLRGTAVAPSSTATPTHTATAPAIVTDLPLPTETRPPTETAVPTPTSFAATATETAVAIPATQTSTAAPPLPTATQTSIAAPTLPTATQTSTPTPSPTNTATATLTPSPTNTPWPTPLPTFTPGPVTRPTLISPERGTSHRTGITFQWRGILQPGQQYRVQLRHTDSGFTLNSPLLDEPLWATSLPAERFGEWHWETAVVSNGVTRIISENWHFYLDPFPQSDNPPTRPSTVTPASTPTNTPRPATSTPAPPTPTPTLPIPN
ncbi:MAG: hypothetical protein H6658_15755 [Ardenticatenaceae bacterium]|nr:hypothetical protein [Ardenticatenaceae bacterium]